MAEEGLKVIRGKRIGKMKSVKVWPIAGEDKGEAEEGGR